MPPLLVDVIRARLPGARDQEEHDDGSDKSAVVSNAEHEMDQKRGSTECTHATGVSIRARRVRR